MIEGALILLVGIIIGAAATSGAVFYLPRREVKQERPYDQYRNEKGLYSRKSVRG